MYNIGQLVIYQGRTYKIVGKHGDIYYDLANNKGEIILTCVHEYKLIESKTRR